MCYLATNWFFSNFFNFGKSFLKSYKNFRLIESFSVVLITFELCVYITKVYFFFRSVNSTSKAYKK